MLSSSGANGDTVTIAGLVADAHHVADVDAVRHGARHALVETFIGGAGLTIKLARPRDGRRRGRKDSAALCGEGVPSLSLANVTLPSGSRMTNFCAALSESALGPKCSWIQSGRFDSTTFRKASSQSVWEMSSDAVHLAEHLEAPLERGLFAFKRVGVDVFDDKHGAPWSGARQLPAPAAPWQVRST